MATETKRSRQLSTLTITPNLAWVTRPVRDEQLIRIGSSRVLDYDLEPSEDISVYSLQPLGGAASTDDGATEYKRVYTGLVLAREKMTPALLRYAIPYPSWTATHALHTKGEKGTWTTSITLPAALPDVGLVDQVSFVHQESSVQPDEPILERQMAKAAMSAAAAPIRAHGEAEDLSLPIEPARLQPGARVVVAQYPVELTYLTIFHVPRGPVGDRPLPTKSKLLVYFPEQPAVLFPGRLSVFRSDMTPTVASVEAQRTDEIKVGLGPDPDVRVRVAQTVDETKTQRQYAITLYVTNSGADRVLRVSYPLEDLRLASVGPRGGEIIGRSWYYDVEAPNGESHFTFIVTYELPKGATRVVLEDAI